jgi:transposase InsO family protein
MIAEYLEGGYSVSELGRRYGISRKTACKWIARFAQEQWKGLEDRSRAPLHQAGAVSETVEEAVLQLKRLWPLWGAPKLHHKLRSLVKAEEMPCESTVSNVLKRHGLTKVPKRRRHHHGGAAAAPYGEEPNDTWCADFKGWWLTKDGRRCDPLTITDAASRYLLRCQAMRDSTGRRMVQPVFLAAFREYGLPRAIRTDNGPPFASGGLGGLSALSVWWMKLGIELERIEPGHPEQNGRHERMHRTLKAAIGAPAVDVRRQQAVFDIFRHEYNDERPHEALDFAVPASRYCASPRPWSERPPGPMEYADDWALRKVKPSGQIKWKGRSVHVTRALIGEYVGLKPQDDGRWEVYFGSLRMGMFDERRHSRVQPLRRKVRPPEALLLAAAEPPLASLAEVPQQPAAKLPFHNQPHST